MTLKWKRAKKTERTNERKQSDLIGLSNGSKRSSEKLHARELSRNKLILRFEATVQHDWPIAQCLLHIRVFFSGKTKRSCFDLFIHWLIKQITNTYRNHFSSSLILFKIYLFNVFNLVQLETIDLPRYRDFYSHYAFRCLKNKTA